MKQYRDVYQQGNLTMWVDLSTYCNAACPQCHRTNPNGLKKVDWLELIQWSITDFQKAFPVKILQRARRFEFCGTWGDPIMNKDLLLICEYIINNSNSEISINTNGGIRSDDWWADLGSLCGDRLTVVFAIDGSTQEIHSTYRQLTNLNLVISNMNAVVYGGSVAKVFTVVFKHNQHDLVNIMHIAKANGAKVISFVESNRFDKSEFRYTNNGQQHLLEKTTLTKHQLDVLCNKNIPLASTDIQKQIMAVLNDEV
jgi:MoaA/NifB/PqqE/SkfB family radical SAM enzyme